MGSPSTMPNPNVTKPSLWRQVLAGTFANLGPALAGAFGVESNEPGAAVAGAYEGIEKAKQRKVAENVLARRESREERQLSLEEQRYRETVAIEREKLGLLQKSTEEQSAITALNKLKLQREIDAMPQEQRIKWMEIQSRLIAAYTSAGLSIRAVTSDSPASVQAALEEFGPTQQVGGLTGPKGTIVPGQNKSPLFSTLIPLHDPQNDKIYWFERRENARFPENTPDIILPTGTRVKLAGQPVGATDSILHLYGVIEAEKVRLQADKQAAAAKAKEQQLLTYKDALHFAQVEAAQIDESESLKPAKDRTFKTPEDRARYVNVRAQQLLDLALSLKREGITEPRTVMSLLPQLRQMQKQGANAEQLREEISRLGQVANLGPLEVVALYKQLGLTGSLSPTGAASPQIPAYRTVSEGLSLLEKQNPSAAALVRKSIENIKQDAKMGGVSPETLASRIRDAINRGFVGVSSTEREAQEKQAATEAERARVKAAQDFLQ